MNLSYNDYLIDYKVQILFNIDFGVRDLCVS